MAKLRIGFWLFPLCVSFQLSAQTAKPKVFFFGGYKATPEQMKCWEDGANKKNLNYKFEGIPYPPGAGADQTSVVRKAEKEIQRIVSEIERNPRVRYVIAGHSSGSAIAHAVAERLKNTSNVELVNLDGFAPKPEIQKKVKTTCWYAVNEDSGVRSRNASAMKYGCQKSQFYSAESCKTAWCLHFSLVNTSAPENLGSKDFGSQGYRDCATNLTWLENRQSARIRLVPAKQ